MHIPLLIWLFLGISVVASAQKADSVATASSHWQLMRIQRSAVSAATVVRQLEFTESFVGNERSWPTGSIGRFTYDVGPAGYAIRRVGRRDGKSGRAFITLPDSLNLNLASTFVIEVDMITPAGTLPEGGLMVGVGEGAGYSLFLLRGQTEFMMKRVADDSSNEGAYTPAGKAITIDTERNTLRVEKHDGRVYFIINGQDVPGDAPAFRKFRGNGVGFVSSASAATFRNLRVTVGF